MDADAQVHNARVPVNEMNERRGAGDRLKKRWPRPRVHGGLVGCREVVIAWRQANKLVAAGEVRPNGPHTARKLPKRHAIVRIDRKHDDRSVTRGSSAILHMTAQAGSAIR